MTNGELDVLEREVEAARGRLRVDLARLRSPDTFARLKEDVTEHVTDATQDTAHRVLADIKARTVANPVAALAIGAGLAWRFAHRPPIASLLVGVGLFSLLKTNPQERYAGADFVARTAEFAGAVKETVDDKIDELSHSELAARAAELSGTVKEKVGQWSSQTSEFAGAVKETVDGKIDEFSHSDLAARAADLSGTVKEKVGRWGSQTSGFASEAAAQVSGTASSLAQSGSKIAAAAVHEDRDTYLLGAAAVALAAAIGISYQRGSN
jgi:hypothetical protein